MSSLVSDFIINPVLRQARRISEISRPPASQLGSDGERMHKILGDEPENPQFNLAPGLGNTESTVVPLQPSSHPVHGDYITFDPEVLSPINSSLIVNDQDSTRSTLVSSVITPQARRYDEDSDSDSMESSRCPSPVNDDGRPSEAITDLDLQDKELPEDDGMAEMRARIREVNSNAPTSEKGKLLHEILMSNHMNTKTDLGQSRDSSADFSGPVITKKLAVSSNVLSINNPLAGFKFWNNEGKNDETKEEIFTLSNKDLEPTYHPGDEQLGCKHYHRNVKLQCFTCKKWYACRLCHDSVEDHELPRWETKNMLCMTCFCPQRTSGMCVNCGTSAARYFCDVCKLWENRPNRPIYHCDDCGICRRGHGLDEDFFHCKTCNACISTSIKSSHKCIERATDCNCPICEDYLFTSRKSVVFMNCGHSIHKNCYERYLANGSYKCPLCNKAIINTESMFRTIDLAIAHQPMPPEYSMTKAVTLCHECSTRTTVPYHWIGLKCGLCQSYNTALIETINHPSARSEAQDHDPTPGEGGNLSSITPADVTLRNDQMMFSHTEVDTLQRLGAMEAHRQALMFGEMTADSGAEDIPAQPSLGTLAENQPQNSTSFLPVRPTCPRTFSRPPIEQLDAESVEHFLQQFDHEAGQDILNLWDEDGNAPAVGDITRNALNSLQKALQNNILDSEDPTGVASMTRNAFNALQQTVQARLDGLDVGHDVENVMALARTAVSALHQAIHGNMVDSDNDGGDEEDNEENSDNVDSDAQSSIADDDPEHDIILLGHR